MLALIILPPRAAFTEPCLPPRSAVRYPSFKRRRGSGVAQSGRPLAAHYVLAATANHGSSMTSPIFWDVTNNIRVN